MESITVNDLKRYKAGITSSSAKAALIGILTVVTSEDDEYSRGTILLLDTVTHEPVTCLVDRMLPKALDAEVYIKKWNYVNLNEGADMFHVEFRLEDLFAAENSRRCFLREQLGTDSTVFQQFVKRKMEYYTPGDSLKQASKVNMAGIVYAISTLYANPRAPAMFFLQITSKSMEASTTTDLKAINVRFSGDDMIKYYRYFQIGGAFVFHNLDVEIIESTTRRNSLCVLSFARRSTCQAITFSQLDNIRKQSPSSNNSTTSTPQLTSVTVHKHKIYTGTITRVIDSMFGIYELDNIIILSLFHLFSYSADMPFRINTRLRLHHFHAVVINPEDGETSHLLQNLWQATMAEEGYMALAACIQSHVEILKFPRHCDNFTETTHPFFLAHNTDIGSQIKHYAYADFINRKSTFTQLLRQLEIYAALTVKFVNTNIVKDFNVFQRAYRTVRDQVFATTRTQTMQAGDQVNDFVLHDTVCLLVGEENFHVVIDAYPSLDKVKNKLQGNLGDYQLDLAGGSTMFEKENVLTQKAEYDQTAEYCILGMLQVSPDGRLYLMDSESRILFVLAAASSDLVSRKAGEIYLVRRLQMFREDLSFVENETEDFIKRKDLFITYFVCQDKDLLLLDGDYDGSIGFTMPGHTSMPTRELEKLSLCRIPPEIRDIPTEHQYLAVRVMTRYPAEVCFTPTGSVYLECRVLVKMYEIEGLGCTAGDEDYIKPTGSTTEYALVFSSRKKTLHLHLDFRVGSDWVIYGLDRPGSLIKSIRENPDFAFALDADKHTIYPLSSTNGTLENIQLQPHYSDRTIVSNPLVYDVSQLADLEKLPAGLSSITPTLNYCQELVHVQGVVIIKRFMEGFSTHSTLNKHATQLYDRWEVSTGKTNRKLFVQLRQPDGLDTISIYMDVHKVHYPVGIVLGATVTFRNLIRKKKASCDDEFFFVADSRTCIHVNNTTPSPNVISMKPALVTTRLISSFLDPVLGRQDQSSKQIFKLYCYISSIINLTLKWECRDCGSIVRKNDCYGMCQGASRVFSVHAFVQISDGTANANASIDGERLVFCLLQLSTNQIDALKTLVLDYGQLSYGAWGAAKITTMDNEEERLKYDPEKDQRNAMHGYTLEDLCNNAKRAGQFHLYGQVKSTPNRKRQREEEGLEDCTEQNLIEVFKLRKFKLSDNGSLLKTAEMSKLAVNVVEIAFPDARVVAYEMLDLLNATELPVGTISSLPSPLVVSDFESLL